MSIIPERRDILDAASHQDYYEVKSFVQKLGALPNTTNSIGQTAAHISAKNGNLKIIKFLLSQDPSLVHVKDNWKQTPLHLAVQKGAIKIVKCLVEEYEANYLEPNYHLQGITVLHIAAAMGHMPILKYFIEEKKMDVNVKNTSGQPPAFSAAANGHLYPIRYFAEETNADFTLVDNHGDNILYMSARRGDLFVPKYLIDEKKIDFDFNWRDNLGETIVNRAAVYEHYEFIKYFIGGKHADVNIADNEGSTPLHEAASLGDMVMVRYLVEHGANPELRNKDGKTAIQVTTIPRVIKYLEEAVRKQSGRKRRSIAERFLFHHEADHISFDRKMISTDRITSKGNLEGRDLGSSLKSSNINSLLLLASASFRLNQSIRVEKVNLLSPREIVKFKMDPSAVHAINKWSDYEQ